jgi:hypothetical protein
MKDLVLICALCLITTAAGAVLLFTGRWFIGGVITLAGLVPFLLCLRVMASRHR